MVADGGAGDAAAAAADVADVLAYVHGSMAVYYGAKHGESSFTEQLQAAAMRAHAAVRARRNAPAHDATSLTLFIGVWPSYYLLQVGDTRCYIWNRDTLTLVTRDGMATRARAADGTLAPAPRASSPMVKIVSESVAADTTLPAVKLLASDWSNVHLLCSANLARHVSDERIAEVLATMTSARQACEQLLQDALAAGATGDVTMAMSRVVPGEAAGAP
jgi:protein phosphatase